MKATSIRRRLALCGLAFSLSFPCAVTVRGEDARPPEAVTSVLFKQGKVYVPKDGSPVEITNDVLVAKLAVVRTNGVFTVGKGKERLLKEGESIGPDGNLNSPDGTVAPIVDHLFVKNGRVVSVRDGVATPLVREVALPDGSKVTPGGDLRAVDGKIRRLLDGQLIKLDGTFLPVTDTVSLQGGKVILYKDGGRIEMRRGQFMAMNDNSRVSGDGYIIKADGTRVNLKEGEILKLEGAR
jgi:hypothetical protein